MSSAHQTACIMQAIRHENLSGFLQTSDRKPGGLSFRLKELRTFACFPLISFRILADSKLPLVGFSSILKPVFQPLLICLPAVLLLWLRGIVSLPLSVFPCLY